MSSWRDRILSEFTPDVARLTLVADPDGLLVEEGILAGIRERGFEMIPFEDHIAFRYAYESKFRSHWDQAEQTDSAVVLRLPTDGLDSLPYDLLQAGRRLSLSLGEIFPKLSYPVLAELDRSDLDALYEARNHARRVLGDNDTKKFILLHVFEIAPELIKSPADLLRVLLRRHYREQRIPTLLDKRLIQLLRRDYFKDWPLEMIVPDREAFFAFLQERWPVFLDQAAEPGSTSIRGDEKYHSFEFPGPSDLPFDHDDVRVYIDNLFLEGFLKAVPHSQAESLSKKWIAQGIRTDEQAARTHHVERLLDVTDTTALVVPDEDARHHDWFHFARTWAELVCLALELDEVLPEPIRLKIEALQMKIDSALTSWLAKRFAGLVNLPPVPPVMLHHIPRFLSRHIDDADKRKAALIVVDGLSLNQWVVVRNELARKRSNYRFREHAVFAWIPTITSVSRQAVFAGKPPFYFPSSIHTTAKEPVLWAQFWRDHKLANQEVAYAKGLGGGTLESVEEMVAQPKTRVVGLVVDTVDKIAHGMELGAAGMHNQVRQWAAQPFMANLVDLLLENGFSVYLTSDHGNTEAAGCGRPAEGALADVLGERARIYPDPLLRGQVKQRFPDSLEWPPIGLPEGYFPLLAPGRSAFVREGDHLVGHGGASIEELVVPLVQIESREK